jgi:hypothetical protein
VWDLCFLNLQLLCVLFLHLTLYYCSKEGPDQVRREEGASQLWQVAKVVVADKWAVIFWFLPSLVQNEIFEWWCKLRAKSKGEFFCFRPHFSPLQTQQRAVASE